jgi:hypothetical protein
LTLWGCSSVPVVSPPRIIEVVRPAPVPVACRLLRAVMLPAGSTAQDVMEAQARVIVEYEEQIRACAR